MSAAYRISAFILFLALLSCKKKETVNTSPSAPQITSVTDNDGQIYPVSLIFGKLWQVKNLNSCTFKNAETMTESKTALEWQQAITNQVSSWCYYDFDSTNGSEYGKIYNVFAITDSRGLAPEGWHISTKNDWELLISNLGDPFFAGYHLKTTTGWLSGANGSDSLHFHAQPGGYYSWNMSNTTNMGKFGWFWAPQSFNTGGSAIFSVVMNDQNDGINITNSVSFNHADGYSVRLVKD